MTCSKGGMSPSQSCHHSLLINAPSSPVGFCIYCAFHFDNGIEALTASRSFIFQYSGHRGLSEGRIAGNSITSHLSALVSFCALINLPVKSFSFHLVITIIIVPPG